MGSALGILCQRSVAAARAIAVGYHVAPGTDAARLRSDGDWFLPLGAEFSGRGESVPGTFDDCTHDQNCACSDVANVATTFLGIVVFSFWRNGAATGCGPRQGPRGQFRIITVIRKMVWRREALARLSI
jgi:hypothetical protein